MAASNNTDPYSPPRAELEVPEQQTLAKYRKGLALIEASAILCMLSVALGLLVAYAVEGSDFVLRFILQGVNGLLMLIAIPLQVAGLGDVARGEEGRRRSYALLVAGVCAVVVFGPALAGLLAPPYVLIGIAKLVHYSRWAAILPVLRWRPPAAEAPVLFNFRVVWVLLATAVTMKVVELVSSVIGAHMMWAFVLFAFLYFVFLVAVAAHASWLRKSLGPSPG